MIFLIICTKGEPILKKTSTKTNQSVEKVFQIIEVMANNRGPIKLQDISEKLGLPPSTVLRFLKTMMLYGYVNQDPETQKYSLSMKFCHIGYLVSSQISIRSVIRPFLVELADRCQESACLAIDQDMMVVYVDVVDGPDKMLKTLQRIGKRAPLHSTGVGKVLLLNYSNNEIDHLIEEKGLTPLTPNTITTKEDLIAELQKVRIKGYAIDDEECEIGARCMAAPIRDYTGKVVAGISVSGPVSRMNIEKIERIQNVIKEIAAKASEKLGYKAEI